MSKSRSAEVAVVGAGAGVIGLAIAVQIAGEGHEIVLIDSNEPGSGASYGHAGTIADYAVSPVGTPAVLRGLPALLFGRDSPLAIRPAALPTLAPWLIRFARQSLPVRAKTNAAAIVRLLAEAVPVIGPLRGGKDIVLAFGHGHLGVTLAPVTARMVGDIVAGRGDADWLEPYAPTRFG